jgi:splicing factor 1
MSSASDEKISPINDESCVPKKRNRWGQEYSEKVEQVDTLGVNPVISNSLTGSGDVEKKSQSAVGDTTHDVNESSKNKRKSRWSTEQVSLPNPSAAAVKNSNPLTSSLLANPLPAANIKPVDTAISQETMQQLLILKIQLNQVNESLLTVVQDAKAIEQDPNRSPSPPPKYDSSGKRTNVREVRMREALIEKRSKIIEEMVRLNPTFPAPVDFLKTKPVKRIYLPKQTNPLYNPIGLIIGPRGNTQKQLEQETGCKISVRGKGSAKEGSKGRASKAVDEDEELHVHIIGDDEEKVAKAARLIEDILKPDDENLNVYKQRQLRELALINGTLREDEYCPICGEKGHKQFECPHRAKAFKVRTTR